MNRHPSDPPTGLASGVFAAPSARPAQAVATPPIPPSPLGFALRVLGLFVFLLLIWPDTSAPAADSSTAPAKNPGQRHVR